MRVFVENNFVNYFDRKKFPAAHFFVEIIWPLLLRLLIQSQTLVQACVGINEAELDLNRLNPSRTFFLCVVQSF